MAKYPLGFNVPDLLYCYIVSADIHDIEVIFVEEHDDIVNPLGAKGLGEVGVAAVGNAIYHTIGKHVQELPITIDKLLKKNFKN